ncbi:hypothetical protein D8S78_18275 [Natrialba swarupiae]|nr:hypothetical protein [Natrialba swarupiae]
MAYTLHYYDIVLICIAVSIATAGVVGTMTTIALEFAVVVFGVALAFAGHALFVNGPVDEPGT